MRIEKILNGTIPLVVAAGLVLGPALSVTRAVTADDDGRGRACSNGTLRGDYGVLVSGIRGAGPGVTEPFVLVGLRTYDGQGSFTDIGSSHGQLTGAIRNHEATGAYEVAPNCTGTTTLDIPGFPFPVVSDFVVVDRGRQVNEAVMSPLSNIVTAVLHRK
jgi:hypothetical protein